MPLKYIGKVPGFAQRTYDNVKSTPFLPEYVSDYHRSPVTQASIRADLFEFRNDTGDMPKDAALDMAIIHTFKAFRLPTEAKMIHLNDIFSMHDLDIWNKSPGLPWRDLGYKTKGDIKRDPEAIRKIRHFWHRVKNGEKIGAPDCLAYVRPHVCKIGESKVRAVWGYPATMTFGEAMYALPLIKAYKEFGPMAYGYETALGGMKKIVRRFGHHKFFYGFDFKKFDKTVPVWLIRKAFKILQYNMDFINYEEHGVAQAVKMHQMWDYIVEYFIHTTIRTSNGCRFRKSSGIASGSYFTQLIGSICNYILCQWICIKLTGSYANDIVVQGDDSLFALDKVFKLSECAEIPASIGLILNLEKSQITSELGTMKFLGYRIGHGIPQKEHDEWMVALMFPETPDLTFAHLQSRALGLYYANMCVDEKFAAICAGLVKMKAFDLVLSRDFERKMKYIGISLDVLKTGVLPSSIQFSRLML